MACMLFDRAPIARQIPPFPMGPDGKSGFDEMSGTLSMGRDVDRLESATIARAQKTHGAWGSYCFGSAQAFTRGSFGAYTES